MTGVLHPVGPEPTQTYWARRAVVLAALVLALALVAAVLVSIVRGASATAAEPSVPASAPASAGVSTPSSDAFTQSPEPEPSVPAPTTGARQSAAAKSPSPTATTAGLQPCDPASLRPTLTGSQQRKVKQHTTFELSLINGSKESCSLTLSQQNFDLTIYSGKDRIWSTADCTTSVKKVSKVLKSEQELAWKVVWDGHRSAKNCKPADGLPGAGTYVATAKFEGAEPVQLRVILHD